MLLLALDTSTRQASVALCTEEELYAEHTWQVGNNHSVELLQYIRRLMAECGKVMSDLDAIAVAIGPGSFNGLRVALATSKSLAFALQKPVLGISTLDIIAARQPQWQQGIVCALLDAGRGEVYAACYKSEVSPTSTNIRGFQMRRLSDYLLLSPQDLSSYIQEQATTWFSVPGEKQLPPILFCGEISEATRQVLHTRWQEQGIFVNALSSYRLASVLASLAYQRLLIGKIDDPLQLEPLYVRHPSITTSIRKQPLLGNKTQRTISQSKTEREEGALRH